MQEREQRSVTTRAGARLAALAAVALASFGLALGSASASSASATGPSAQLAPVRQVPVCSATFGRGLKSVRRVSIAGPAVENTSRFATVGIGGHSL